MRTMVIYINEDDIVKEFINFGYTTQGSSNVDRVYVIYNGTQPSTMSYMLSGGATETVFTNTTTSFLSNDEEAGGVYVGSVDLKELKLFKNYTMWYFDFTSEDLSIDGARKMTIALRFDAVGTTPVVKRVSVYFEVDSSVIQDTATITLAQYDYLLGLFSDLKTPYIELTNNVAITEEQMAKLTNDKSAYILYANEKYYLMDIQQDGSNTWVYAHTGDQTLKYLNVYTNNLTTLNWSISTENRLVYTII